MKVQNIPRPEYPRPQFVRSGSWLNLNGEWDFSFEDKIFDKRIIVPYAYQTKLSGIDIQDFHDVVWYRRSFYLPEDMKGKRIILHFGAVDYKCDVWVNDNHVTSHIGGHIGFEVEITDFIKEENIIVVRAEDDTFDLEMPRGKQFWKEKSEGIFYTRTTGIWQTVWIEALEDTYLSRIWLTPDLDSKAVDIEYEIDGNMYNKYLKALISFEGVELAEYIISEKRNRGAFRAVIDQQAIVKWNFQEELQWTPENPRLFDIKFYIYNKDGQLIDKVSSYFGMRKVSIVDGKFMLNNRPYYQKLVLDQGYWEESLLTAPTDEAFIRDIQLAKEMGFNGARKHQKIEDPRYLYWADKLGFLVWGEIAATYVYSRRAVNRLTNEWMDALWRDYNHPSIVAWTPINESWGVPNILNNRNEQSFSAAMVYLTKSLDSTRPVISNDGWEHTHTDLLTIHDYCPDKKTLIERYKSLETILDSMPAGRRMFAQGWSYSGQPILVTEFGGISYKKGDWEGWGYSSASSDDDYGKRYYDVVSAMLESDLIQGFCYTQLTDVEQEINGLLTYDRKPKIDTEIIRDINEGKLKL